jgi:DNA-binding GntR family transcriptional regulator
MLKLPKVPNLTERAYQSVKEHLLNGSFGEGARLTEESIANQLGISKSPVREALNRLESEGLICIESRRGAYVRRFSVQETRDLFDLREVLEVHAVGRAKMSAQVLRELAESVERTRQCLAEGDKLGHIEEDMRFHGILAMATENTELMRVLDNVQQKSLLCRMKTYYLSSTTAPVSHEKIYLALKQGDCEAAQEAMRAHIVFVRDALLGALEADGEETVVVGEEVVLA